MILLHKLDWLSFTLPVDTSSIATAHELPRAVWRSVDGVDLRLGDALGLETESVPTKTRAPYAVAWHFPDAHMTVFASSKLSHCLFEFSGRGVDRLDRFGNLSFVIASVIDRITRIDIATDILTDVRPLDFAPLRDVKRFKTHSEFVSPSGETCYVGSRTSDRYARVYRYNPPHDRARFLRVETSCKGPTAKIVASHVLSSSLTAVAESLGKVFGWSHPVWSVDVSNVEAMKAYRPERHIGKTEYWLNNQVAPVLKRLHRENILDVQEWLNEYVLGDKRND